MLKFQVTASKSPHPQILPSGKTEKKRYACHALRKDITPSTGGFLKALEPGDTEGERGEVTGRRLGPLDGERERERERETPSSIPSLSTVPESERHPPTPLWSLFYGQHRRVQLLINGGTSSYERSPQDEKPVFRIPESIWKEGLRLSVTP